jgi:hypothetical protein
MRRNGNRTIKVDKKKLIEQIKENKVKHIESYNKAVEAYKLEAISQLTNLLERANNGELNLKLDLVSPINNSENYDKVIQIFEWEVDDIVELEQQEFIEYVQDETDFAIRAKTLNSSYLR